MLGPTVKIYQNRITGEFRIQPYARHFGTPQEFGSPTVLPPTVGDAQLLSAILENLPKTDVQEYNLTLAPKYSADERRRVLKQEKPIAVFQCDIGYELQPMKRLQNSFGSIDSMTRMLPTAEFLARGGRILRDLLEKMK